MKSCLDWLSVYNVILAFCTLTGTARVLLKYDREKVKIVTNFGVKEAKRESL